MPADVTALLAAAEARYEQLRRARDEDVAEIAYLLSAGVRPAAAARRVGRSLAAAEIMCRRAGRRDIAQQLDRARKADR